MLKIEPNVLCSVQFWYALGIGMVKAISKWMKQFRFQIDLNIKCVQSAQNKFVTSCNENLEMFYLWCVCEALKKNTILTWEVEIRTNTVRGIYVYVRWVWG